MKNIQIVVLSISLFAFSSCEKLILKKDQSSLNPYKNFDYLWNEVDKKYSFFELKNIDWNQIGTQYRSKLYEGMTADSLFKVLGGMLNELRDDHVNLVSSFNRSRYNVALKYPKNYDNRVILENYLNNDIYYAGSFFHGFLANKEVGYINYRGFDIALTANDLDFALNRYQNTKGLIIDLRANGGGDLQNVITLLERFLPQKTLVSYNRARNGKGHNEFGPSEPFFIGSKGNVKYLNKPVMVLIDRGSYSATTFFSLATKAIPNFKLVGDTTGGGGGLPNGGQLPNGWTYRFSVSQALDLNRNNYAESGVPVDYPVLINLNDQTKDAVIDKAIDIILK